MVRSRPGKGHELGGRDWRGGWEGLPEGPRRTAGSTLLTGASWGARGEQGAESSMHGGVSPTPGLFPPPFLREEPPPRPASTMCSPLRPRRRPDPQGGSAPKASALQSPLAPPNLAGLWGDTRGKGRAALWAASLSHTPLWKSWPLGPAEPGARTGRQGGEGT